MSASPICEHLYSPGFNPVEFDGIKKLAGLYARIQWWEGKGEAGDE
jgi:hypothetical protein